MDVMVSIKMVSWSGARYVLTFVDDYSRYMVAYLSSTKARFQLSEASPRHCMEISGESSKCLRSDNEIEFLNKKVAEICTKSGVLHQLTVRTLKRRME